MKWKKNGNSKKKAPSINIDGVDYLLDDLSSDVKAQLQSLQFIEAELARLNALIAVTSTAKIAYQNALKDLLPK